MYAFFSLFNALILPSILLPNNIPHDFISCRAYFYFHLCRFFDFEELKREKKINTCSIHTVPLFVQQIDLANKTKFSNHQYCVMCWSRKDRFSSRSIFKKKKTTHFFIWLNGIFEFTIYLENEFTKYCKWIQKHKNKDQIKLYHGKSVGRRKKKRTKENS